MARLRLSRTDKIILGVCGGLAPHFGIDTTILRILFVIATIFGFGSPIIVYLVLYLVMRFQ